MGSLKLSADRLAELLAKAQRKEKTQAQLSKEYGLSIRSIQKHLAAVKTKLSKASVRTRKTGSRAGSERVRELEKENQELRSLIAKLALRRLTTKSEIKISEIVSSQSKPTSTTFQLTL